jgi:hypothetical protein
MYTVLSSPSSCKCPTWLKDFHEETSDAKVCLNNTYMFSSYLKQNVHIIPDIKFDQHTMI